MKLCLSLTTVLMLLISTSLRAQFSGGTGTATDPYQIANRQDMVELSDFVANSPAVADSSNWSADKYFILIADIPDSVRTAVGDAADWRRAFQGDFNGNGKKITLAIGSPQSVDDSQAVGRALFAGLANADVYDLAVDGYVKGFANVGGVCGLAKNSNISGCVSCCEVTGRNKVGGICGEFGGFGRLFRCKNYGKIVAIGTSRPMGWKPTSYYAGGIAGIVSICRTADTLTNCLNYGDVTGVSDVGGIAGKLLNSTPSPEFCALSYCANAGAITATVTVGGIIGGSGDNVGISHCINIGTITGFLEVGGITSGAKLKGWAQNTSVYCCHNAGLVTGTYNAGGIQGLCLGEIINCLVTSGVENPITSYSGWSQNFIIKNCHFDKQMGWFGAEEPGRIGKHATKEMLGTKLQAKLGTTDWSYDTANLYPTLKYFAKDSIGMVAASPVYLPGGYNQVRANFKVSLENNVKWDMMVGNAEIVNEDGILLKAGPDTLVCSLGHIRKLVPITVQYRPLTNTCFTIRPTNPKYPRGKIPKNYDIQICIEADAPVWSKLLIKKMVIGIDRRLFQPKKGVGGDISSQTLNGNMLEITVENITVPQMGADTETTMFYLVGEVLQGEIDSSIITISPDIEFSEPIFPEPVVQNGSFTLDFFK